MVEKIKDHVVPEDIEKMSNKVKIAGLSESEDDDDTNVDIPEVLLELEL